MTERRYNAQALLEQMRCDFDEYRKQTAETAAWAAVARVALEAMRRTLDDRELSEESALDKIDTLLEGLGY